MGGTVNFVNVHEEEGFQYQPEEVARHLTPSTKAILIIINSPANPTGSILSPEAMHALAGPGYYLVADEPYHGLVYDDLQEHSILEFTDKAFLLGSFSKQYAMTGWRLGYLIVPKESVRPIQKIQQNFFIGANAFVQWAGIAAITKARKDAV